MEKKIKQIYENLIQELEEDVISIEMKKEILKLLEDERKQMSEQKYGKCRDKAFLIANVGEEAGFIRGFRYAFGLFMELGGNL